MKLYDALHIHRMHAGRLRLYIARGGHAGAVMVRLILEAKAVIHAEVQQRTVDREKKEAQQVWRSPARLHDYLWGGTLI